MLKNKCQNLSLYSRLRTLLTVSAVTATIFFANLLCNEACYEGDDNTSIWVALFTLVSSIIIITMQVQIRSDISDCADNTDNYKLIVLYAGIVPSIFPLLYSLYMIYVWFNTAKERRGIRERERMAKRQLAQQEKLRKQEEEAAERTRAAEEAQKRADAIRAEREAKRQQQIAEAEARAKAAAEKAAEARRKAEDERRKRQGKFTPEELVEQAKERQKAKEIGDAKAKVDKVQAQIKKVAGAEGKPDTEKLVRLGEELVKAKEALKAAEGGEVERRRGFGPFGGMF
jgi:flagellar biosynthesis GTPase FlhF